MKVQFFAAALAATVFATPAFAAEFTGPRAELRVGYESVDADAGFVNGAVNKAASGSEDGVTYGVEVGYDHKIGSNFILGAYAGIDFSDADDCAGPVLGNDQACFSAGRNITAGIRAGVQVAPRVLLYAKGGYSNGRFKLAYDGPGTANDFNLRDNRDGFHVGAGAEFAVTEKAYAKLEYVYTDYEGRGYKNGAFGAAYDTNRHQVMAGVGFRF
jgi:outer membrane immunogenic protein